MKKLCTTLLFSMATSAGFCAFPVVQQSITSVGTGTTVSVSTSAWTLVPAASSLNGRNGVFLGNPTTNNADMVVILSTSSSAPAEATTVNPIELADGVNLDIRASNKIFIWIKSLHTAAENVHVQEYKQ